MKKRVFLIFLILVAVSLCFKLYVITTILASMGLLAVVSYLLGSKISHYWEKMPKLLDDSTRNYSCLELGYCKIDDNGLDLTQKYSNLYSDFLVLKRFYSLVKKNGTIIINMKASDNYMFRKKPSIFSLCMLHPVTLLELAPVGGYYVYEITFREFLNPLLFLLKELKEKIVDGKGTCNYNNNLMDKIEDFCKERNLHVEWYINSTLLER